MREQFVQKFCPETGKHHREILLEQSGEVVCKSCGLVLAERIIQTDKKPRAFNREQKIKRQHYGSPITPLVPDIQMSTMVKKWHSLNRRLKKALRWDTRYTWRQRNLLQAITEIKRIGTHLNEPLHVMKYAAKLYRKAYNRDLLKGRSIKAMVAACVYYAGNREGIPTALHEVEKYSNVNRRKINVCFYSLVKTFNLRSPIRNIEAMVTKPVANLDLPFRIEKIAQKIICAYRKRYAISGKDPKGIVAGAIYFAVENQDLSATQSDIVKEIGITEVTMRKRYREIRETADYIRKKLKHRRAKD